MSGGWPFGESPKLSKGLTPAKMPALLNKWTISGPLHVRILPLYLG